MSGYDAKAAMEGLDGWCPHTAGLPRIECDVCVVDAIRVAHKAGRKEGATEVMGLRPIVCWFARRMERKLKANDHKGGWDGCSPEWLLSRLREEVEELAEVVASRGTGSVDEAADVANMAMMVADVLTQLRAAALLEGADDEDEHIDEEALGDIGGDGEHVGG